MSATLSIWSNVDETYEAEINAFARHVRGDYDYHLDIEPMPTPRPRSRIMNRKAGGAPFVHVYHPAEYTKYKEEIVWRLKDASLQLRPGDYSALYATFYMPYPVSTPKKNLIENAKHRKKPDYDNFIKGFQDALEQAGIVVGDGVLSDGSIRKRYTTQPKGFIRFTLI
jgi:Holliday junction resolvase RusA-like endonuclease